MNITLKWDTRLRVFFAGIFQSLSSPPNKFMPAFVPHIIIFLSWIFLCLLIFSFPNLSWKPCKVFKVRSKTYLALGWHIKKQGGFLFFQKGHLCMCNDFTETIVVKALYQNNRTTFALLFFLCRSLKWPWFNYLHLNEWIYIESEG